MSNLINMFPSGGGSIDSSKYTTIINVSTTLGTLTDSNVTVNDVKYPLIGSNDSVSITSPVGTTLAISFDDKLGYIKPIDISYTVTSDVVVKMFNVVYVYDIAYIDVNLSSADGASIIGQTITVGEETKTASSSITRFDVKSTTQYTVSVGDWDKGSSPAPKDITTGEVNSVANVDMQYYQCKIYGVKIDETNSNPLTAVTYTDDAIGMAKGSDDWDNMRIFENITPVVKPLGITSTLEEDIILNKNDFRKREDGTPIDISKVSTGNVFSRLKKFAYMIYREDTYLYVKITDSTNAKSLDERFAYHGFSWDTEGDCDYAYVGAFLSGGQTVMNSIADRQIAGTSYAGDISRATTNGVGYQIISFYLHTMLQCLYLIKYGNLDSQSALGKGYVNDVKPNGSPSKLPLSGETVSKGMYFGEQTGLKHMKFAGIEDFWGSDWLKLGGVLCNNYRKILTKYKDFNVTGAGYIEIGTYSSDTSGFMKAPKGNTELGFLPDVIRGSDSTYYTDYVTMSLLGPTYPIQMAMVSGRWDIKLNCGAFSLDFNTNIGVANYVSRLCYMRKAVKK